MKVESANDDDELFLDTPECAKTLLDKVLVKLLNGINRTGGNVADFKLCKADIQQKLSEIQKNSEDTAKKV